MNTNLKRNTKQSSLRHMAGMALLDILLAMVIFVIGMLALAHLQGNLSRSSGDANARTVAANIAEEFVEALRSYSAVELAAGGTCPSTLDGLKTAKVFECIDTVPTFTITRGGVAYDVDLTVTDWYFLADRQNLTSNKSHTDLAGRDLSISDFKRIDVAVDWDVVDFRVDDANTGDMGSGSFTASSVVPSIPVLGSAKIAADDDGAMGTPPVAYTPGQLPDVIPINLNGSKFKESETPMPDVTRADNIVETWFDVITYNNLGQNNSQYLRREEFAVVACECTLRGSAGGEGDGFLPTTWNGEEYTEGAWVSKQYGESANNQQSQYCDTCCRDHHDVAGNTNADTLYRPGSGTAHGHYVQSKQGAWSAARTGDDYLEVCRMVRKDGFMRVAQDFKLDGMIATRQAYFTETANVTSYSTHVTDSVSSKYGAGNVVFGSATFPGDAANNANSLPTTGGSDFDQQVSRALYMDYVTTELQAKLTCIQNNNATCIPPGVSTELEILPFYEVQTTWLSFWRDNVSGRPVEVSSDTIADDNSHSRGMAELTDTDVQTVRADTYIHSGNNGLTSTDPIDSGYDGALVYRDLYIDTNGGGGGGSTNPHGASGSMTGTGGIKVTDAVFTPGSGVYCNHDANSFECTYDGALVTSPSVTITGYVKNKDAWVCETSGTTPALSISNDFETGRAVIDLSAIGSDKVTTYHLSFQPSSCGS